MLIVTADRGLAGGYSSNAIKEGEELTALLDERGMEAVPYVVGRKAVGYYRFRGREIAATGPASPTSPRTRTPRRSLRHCSSRS